MKTDLYFNSNKVKINDKEYTDKVKVTIKEMIEIIKKNSGNLWGVCPRPDFCYGDGSVFELLLDKEKNVSFRLGSRFFPNEIKNPTEKTLQLWSLCYKKGAFSSSDKKIFIGKATPQEEIEILQLNEKAVVFLD